MILEKCMQNVIFLINISSLLRFNLCERERNLQFIIEGRQKRIETEFCPPKKDADFVIRAQKLTALSKNI